MEDAFVACSQELCVHFQVPLVAFPPGGAAVQNLRHVLGDGLGKGDLTNHDTGKVKGKKDQMEYVNDRTWPYHGMSLCAVKLRTSVLNRFWRDHISDKHGRRGDVPPHVRRPFAAVPKATFSCAMEVMDKVEGWIEEQWVGSHLAAPMWMCNKAALCDGRKRDPPSDMQTFLVIIIESVSWVTEDSLWDHEWITKTKVTMKENHILEALRDDIEVPCPLQWALLCFAAPTNLNRKFVNNGTKVAQFRDTVSSAIELTCNVAFGVAHTP